MKETPERPGAADLHTFETPQCPHTSEPGGHTDSQQRSSTFFMCFMSTEADNIQIPDRRLEVPGFSLKWPIMTGAAAECTGAQSGSAPGGREVTWRTVLHSH